jgi:hypothetical protein
VTYVLLLLFGVVFVELVVALDFRTQVVRIHAGARDAFRMLASDASDDEKEAAMRRESLGLFRATGIFLVKLLAVGAALALLYALVVMAWPAGERDLVASFTSPVDIAVVSIVLVLYAWGRHAVAKKLQRA